MKVLGIVLGVLLLLGGCSAMWAVSVNNQMVRLNQDVNEKWSQVQNVYQRRADLVPNLVETISGYAKHERGTLEAVTQARASATQVKIDPSNLTPETLKQFATAQATLGGALSRLLVSVERYPNLKANKLFLGLQSQLEGTENRITVERRRYNEAVKAYNTRLEVMPGALVISSKYKARLFFEAEEGAKTAPKVKF